jgi:CheY-like chemotaxis protein
VSTTLIWIADDDPIDLELSRISLESLDIPVKVQAFEDGTSLLSAAAANLNENDCRPNLIILDMKMPGPNGVETARELLNLGWKDIPLCIFSSCANGINIEEANHAGVSYFIQKPSNLKEFSDALRRIPQILISEKKG